MPYFNKILIILWTRHPYGDKRYRHNNKEKFKSNHVIMKENKLNNNNKKKSIQLKNREDANVCVAQGYSTTCSSKRVSRLHCLFISALLPCRPMLSATAFFPSLDFTHLRWLGSCQDTGTTAYTGQKAPSDITLSAIRQNCTGQYLGFLVCWANRRTNK